MYTRDNAMEWCHRRARPHRSTFSIQLVEGILVEYVDVIISIHADLGHSDVLDHWLDHEGEASYIDDVVRVVMLVEGDQPLKPFEVDRGSGCYRIDLM